MSIAFCLSGGGAKGDFEIGALRYLYDHKIEPDIICGCSVGSINGAKLAEGEGSAERGLQGLEQIWASLLTNSDMYQEEGWLNTIDPQIKALLTGQPGANLSGPAIDFSRWGTELGALITLASEFGWLVTEGASILKAIDVIKDQVSIYNLNPIWDRLTGNLPKGIPQQLFPNYITEWSNNGQRKLRLATVSLDAGRLRYTTESGEVVERDGTTPVLEPRAECIAISNGITALQAQKQRLAAELPTSNDKRAIVEQIVELNKQIAMQTQALSACLLGPGTPLTVGIADGVIASSSIGGIFPPYPLGGEMYVDGGFRTVLPTEVAVHLGADTIYAISASPGSGPNYIGPFAGRKLLDIVSREFIDNSIDEISYRDANPATGWGTRSFCLIEPSIDIHDIYTIDPGLIRISIGYGYMRADDAVNGHLIGSPLWQQSDDITQTRLEVWRLECLLSSQPVATDPNANPPNSGVVSDIWSTKSALRTMIGNKISSGGALPQSVLDAGWKSELHSWGTAMQLPFIGLSGGTRLTTISRYLDGSQIDLFVTGLDGFSYLLTYNDHVGEWTGWFAFEGGQPNSLTDDSRVGWSGPGSPISVVSRYPGGAALDVFVIDAFSRVYTAFYNDANWRWSGWFQILGAIPSGAPSGTSVTALARAPAGSSLDIWITGNDGNVYTAFYNDEAGIWEGWVSIIGPIPSGAPPGTSITALSRYPGGHQLDIWVTGNDGSVYTAFYNDADGSWHGWIQIVGQVPSGAPAGATVAAISRDPSGSQIDLYLTGNDGNVYTAFYNDSSGDWRGWVQVGGSIPTGAPAGASVSVLSRYPGGHQLDIWVTGNDGNVYTAFYNDAVGIWHDWVWICGVVPSGAPPGAYVSALSRYSSGARLDLWVTSSDGNVYTAYYDDAGPGWTNWILIGGERLIPPPQQSSLEASLAGGGIQIDLKDGTKIRIGEKADLNVIREIVSLLKR